MPETGQLEQGDPKVSKEVPKRISPPRRVGIIGRIAMAATVLGGSAGIMGFPQSEGSRSAEPLPVPTGQLGESGGERSNPQLNVSVEDAKLNYERLTQPRTLTPGDARIRDSLVSNLRKDLKISESDPVEGPIYETKDLVVAYASGPDAFEAEIQQGSSEKEFTQAKEQFETWLRGKGFTNPGICNLKLTYSVNLGLRKTWPEDYSVKFDPNPLACKLKQ